MQRRKLIKCGVASIALPVYSLARASVPTVGVTLPLTGVQAEVARELEIGYRLAASEAGFAVKVLDDQSVPANVAKNVKLLSADPSVAALSGIVGTPHAEAGLATAKAEGLPVVGIRSGAQFLRAAAQPVFHLRASYEDELDMMVKYCKGAGVEHMGIMYSDDSFGKSSRDHLVRRLAEAGIKVSSNISVERNGSNIVDATERTAASMRTRGFGAVALLLIVKPMVAAATELRIKHKILFPILAMSFTITGNVATTRDKALSGLGLVSAFPLPRAGVDVRRRYRSALKREGHEKLLESVTVYEGYFYGLVAGQAVLAAGGSRTGTIRRLQQTPVQLGDTRVDFTGGNVGYRYLEFLHKAENGLLRT